MQRVSSRFASATSGTEPRERHGPQDVRHTLSPVPQPTALAKVVDHAAHVDIMIRKPHGALRDAGVAAGDGRKRHRPAAHSGAPCPRLVVLLAMQRCRRFRSPTLTALVDRSPWPHPPGHEPLPA